MMAAKLEMPNIPRFEIEKVPPCIHQADISEMLGKTATARPGSEQAQGRAPLLSCP
jgi:hypothetical protein